MVALVDQLFSPTYHCCFEKKFIEDCFLQAFTLHSCRIVTRMGMASPGSDGMEVRGGGGQELLIHQLTHCCSDRDLSNIGFFTTTCFSFSTVLN